MTRRPMGVISLVILTLVALMGYGCGEASQNNTVNQNRSAVANQNTAVEAITPDPDPARETDPDLGAIENTCKGPIDETRRGNVENAIKDGIQHFRHLDLKTRVIIITTPGQDSYLEVQIEGRIKRRDRMNKLDHILHRVLKNNCARRIVFVRPGTIKDGDKRSLAADGFVWGCQDPEELCPNGECRRPGQCNPVANTNMNTNSDSGNRNR